MIYLDNAATTMRKPPQVVQAVVKALESIGNAGRGAYPASLDASRIIYDTRVKLAEFFGGDHAEQIAFTANHRVIQRICLWQILLHTLAIKYSIWWK